MPFEHLRPGEGDYVIVADHASNRVPQELGQLGVCEKTLDIHIAYDLGTDPLARALSTQLASEAIISNVSRLVIDKNRRLDQSGLMPDVSDGVEIPGNRDLSAADIEARAALYYHPYHERIAEAVAARATPVLISLHSFTPVMNGFERPWECGLLWNKDDRLALRAVSWLEGQGLKVGRNEPYPGDVYNATMDRHAEANGHPYLMLEVRNDLLAQSDQIQLWSIRVSAMLSDIV